MNCLPPTDLDHILDHTRDLWDELRSERIFITGGTGFFGKWLLESLLWANDQLGLDLRSSVLTRSPDAFKSQAPYLAGHAAVSLIQGDVRSFSFPNGEFSHIVHAATYMQPYSEMLDPRRMFEENIEGTSHILNFSQDCRASRFLFTSSGAVYGKQPPEITHLSEDYSGAPETTQLQAAYGQSKRASEFLCTAMAGSTFQVKIARCFAFVGPHIPLDTNYAIGNFIQDALNGDPILIKGDGTPRRSYLYMADLAIWLWTILMKGRSAYPYNVGSERDLSIAELAKTVVGALDPGLPIQIAQSKSYDRAIERYVPSTQRARKDLGLQEFIPLPQAVKSTAQWYLPFSLKDTRL